MSFIAGTLETDSGGRKFIHGNNPLWHGEADDIVATSRPLVSGSLSGRPTPRKGIGEAMKILLFTLNKQTTKENGMPQTRRSMWISTLLASLLFTLAWVLTPNSFGQGITGSITGDVTDASGASLTGATVSIRQVD